MPRGIISELDVLFFFLALLSMSQKMIKHQKKKGHSSWEKIQRKEVCILVSVANEVRGRV